MFVWGAAQRGIPPEVNVVGTVMFLARAGAGAGSAGRCSAAGTDEHAPDRSGPPAAAGAAHGRRSSGSRTPTRPEPRARRWPAATDADLLVVGGGYTGLWAALRAKERDPDRDVVAARGGSPAATAATGRNGGFASTSLDARPRQRRPTLARGAAAPCDRLGADEPRGDRRRPSRGRRSTADWERDRRALRRARRRTQVERLARGGARRCAAAGHDVPLLDRAGRPSRVASPTYLGGLLQPDADRDGRARPAGVGAAAAVSRRRACGSTRARRGRRSSATARGARSARRRGTVRAHARGAGHRTRFPPLLRRLRLMTVPVYDYVLMTEPLSPDAACVGGLGRPGGRRRLGQPLPLLPAHPRTTGSCGAATTRSTTTAAGSTRVRGRAPTHALLARHFFETFPQLEGLRFTHRWAGVIDTCTRFAAFFGTALGRPGRLRARLHRPGGRRDPLRRRRRARPGGRTRADRADRAADGA